jgi:EF-P beta-lysylation protein EpmB
MIAASPHKDQSPAATPAPTSWRTELAAAVTDARQLCALLDLDPTAAGVAASPFPLRVPLSYIRRMRKGDYADPLLRQVLSTAAELTAAAGYSSDPLQEAMALKAPGLMQKYAGRVLLIATAACGVHCRYCFRREFPYAEHGGDASRWQQAVAAIAADTGIQEVILSGGDPLSLGNARLHTLTERLRGIAHLRRLRIHTRQPIVLPARVDAGFCDWLRRLPWPCALVLHANHANEIDTAVITACRAMRDTGIVLLNQSVLLAGVNDSAVALADLSEALWRAGVQPYYLHLLDRVRGTSHFEVTQARALALHAELQARLPGYLVPRLVRELPGAPSKITLA